MGQTSDPIHFIGPYKVVNKAKKGTNIELTLSHASNLNSSLSFVGHDIEGKIGRNFCGRAFVLEDMETRCKVLSVGFV